MKDSKPLFDVVFLMNILFGLLLIVDLFAGFFLSSMMIYTIQDPTVSKFNPSQQSILSFFVIVIFLIYPITYIASVIASVHLKKQLKLSKAFYASLIPGIHVLLFVGVFLILVS